MVVARNIDSGIDSGDLLADIRRIAESVPDPELVVVTVGDLGIIRDVRRDGASVEIDVTPTYSACPATLAIELAIETAVAEAGHDVRVRRVLAPAWTTDWITPAGRAKLKDAGIAPPRRRANSQVDDDAYFARRWPVRAVTALIQPSCRPLAPPPARRNIAACPAVSLSTISNACEMTPPA
jgi:phenylacetate-CoA oxygenase PaaJ subunit